MSASRRIGGCRACGSVRLSTFLNLGDLPLTAVFTGTAEEARTAKRYPLEVAFCTDCTLVQVLETVPPEEMFGQNYPYFSSFTDTLLTHAREIVASCIKERGLGPESFAVELASNDGYLLQNYLAAGIPHLGIDPSPGPVAAARQKGVNTTCAFFGLELARQLKDEGKSADIIHGNNVLAHVEDTNGFVAGIATLLKESGIAVIEVPYVRDLVDHGEFDTIYHEHIFYFSVTALRTLFKRHGLYLNRIERLAIHGGSLRLFVEKQDSCQSSVRRLLAEEQASGLDRFAYYADFADRVGQIRRKLVEMLEQMKASGLRIAGYGAAAKGTILLNYTNIGAEILDYVVDRNTHKQGWWVPGVALPIVSPEQIEQNKPDVLLILPWNFKDEIMRQQQAHAARGGRFIVPIPEPMFVEPT